VVWKVAALAIFLVAVGGLSFQLNFLRKVIMATKDEVVAELTNLKTEVENANTKADTLIALVGTLKKQIADLQASGGATPADLDGVLASIKDAEQSLKDQEAQDDAAAGA
jgi:septal ring factor EnvC (AmiA/AmiB activator)